MTLVALYARYSSDNQRDASIEDQIEVCRRYADRMGWRIGPIYTDRAISGASVLHRPGYQQMMQDAPDGRFDAILVEHLDRLSRRLADIADIHDQLTFLRVKLYAENIGEVTPIHTAVMGMMAQQYLTDLADKTRRGQLGRAMKGKIPGGLAYGYRMREADGRGERIIHEAEAGNIRRIFRMFADGLSPRRIAHILNGERTPGPNGRPWQDTTIRGQVARGTGLLNNTLYVGLLSWNRCSYVKDPRTGRRVARPNPAQEWEVVPVPDLRIVDDELWQRVKARQAQIGFEIARNPEGQALNRAHRKTYLLSGLLICGECGSPYVIIAPDTYGCSAHRRRGDCDNGGTIAREAIEARVWRALKERMMAPELLAEFARAFQAEIRRLERDGSRERAGLEDRLATTERQIERLIDVIAEGGWSATVKERLAKLEAEKAELKQSLAGLAPPAKIVLHPNLPDLYRAKLESLERILEGDPETSATAMEAVRSLITQIELRPRPGGGLDALVHGDLAEMVALAEGRALAAKDPRGVCYGGRLSVVAGTGFEPVTFRL